MLRDSPQVRRILAITAATLVVAALVAVVVTGGDGDDSALAGSESTSTTRPVTGGDDAGEGATTAPAAGTDTSTPPPTEAPMTGAADGGEVESPDTQAAPEQPGTVSGDPGATEDPGPATAPGSGTYVYSFSRESSDGETQSGEARTVVDDQGEAGGERRQSVRQEEGEQGSFTSSVAWRSDGVYVMSTTFSFGGTEEECDWDPDFRNLAAPLDAGVRWSYQTSCTVTFNGTPVKIDREGDFEVIELTRIEVAGEVVDVWKIESVVNMSFGSFGSSTEETTAFFSPRHGLPVKSSSRVEASGQGQSGTVVEEREIKNLSPQ